MYKGGTVDTVVYEARDLEELNKTTSSIEIPKRGTWINVTVQTEYGKCFMFNATVPSVVAPEQMESVFGSIEDSMLTKLNISGACIEDAVVSTNTRVYTLDGKLPDAEAYRPLYRSDFRNSLSKAKGVVDRPGLHMLMGILAATSASSYQS